MGIDRNLYKILVIEHNDRDFLLLEGYLKEKILAPEIVRATTLNEGREVFHLAEETFDVVLLDLSLPEKNEDELIKKVKIIADNIPVIMLTCQIKLDWAIKALVAGLSDYLLKDELSPLLLYKSIRYNIERHKYVKTLQLSQKRYSDLFQMCPLPIWVYDLKSLKFLDVNESAVRHYGYTKEQYMSMTIKDIRPSEDLEILEKVLSNPNRNTEGFYWDGVYRHLLNNGDIIYVNIHSNFINFNGTQARIVLATDITERLLYTKTIEEQNEKLKEIAWLQSHVVRAPLSRIIGLIHVLSSKKLNGEQVQAYLQHVLDAAQELDAIVNDVVKKSSQINLNPLKQ